MEPKPCNGTDRVRKHTSAVTCTVSPFPEDADLSQVTPEIQHSPRFLSGTVRIYSQSVLHWLLYSSVSALAVISPFSASQGFLTHLLRRMCPLQTPWVGTEGHSHWQVQGVFESELLHPLRAGPLVEGEKSFVLWRLCGSHCHGKAVACCQRSPSVPRAAGHIQMYFHTALSKERL